MQKNNKNVEVVMNEDVGNFIENFKKTYSTILLSYDELYPFKMKLKGLGYYKSGYGNLNKDFPSLLAVDLTPEIEDTVEKQKDKMWKFFDLGDSGSVFHDHNIKIGKGSQLSNDYLKLLEEKIQNGYDFIKKIKTEAVGRYTDEEFEKIYFAKIILRSHLYAKYFNLMEEVDRYEVLKELNNLDLESISMKGGIVYVVRDSFEKLENSLCQGFMADMSNLRSEADALKSLNKYIPELQELFDNDLEEFDELCQKVMNRDRLSNFKKFMIVNFNIRGKRKFYELSEKKDCFKIKKIKNLSVVYIDKKLISVNNKVFENILNELEILAKNITITKTPSEAKIVFTNEETKELDKRYFKELIVEVNSLMSKSVVYDNKPDSIRQVYQNKFSEIRERYLHECLLLSEKSGSMVRAKPKI